MKLASRAAEAAVLLLFMSLWMVACNNKKNTASYETVLHTVDNVFHERAIDSERLGNVRFVSGNTIRDPFAKSGQHVLALSSKQPFGFSTHLTELQAGERFRVSVWRKETVSNAGSCIVIIHKAMNRFYLCQHKSDPHTMENKWAKMSVEFTVPASLAGDSLDLYIYSPDTSVNYFDDFKIELIHDYRPVMTSARFVIRDDRDGKEYPVVRIGKQAWLARNLDYDMKHNGCKYYGNDSTDRLVMGRLYQYEVARECCPAGWKLPTDSDWAELEHQLGIERNELFAESQRGIDQGQRLKPGGDSGFEAMPAGNCNEEGDGWYKGNVALFWTATSLNDTMAICRELNNRTDIGRFRDNKKSYFSVRCMKTVDSKQ